MSPGFQFEVPVITEHDLRAFQSSHFPSSTGPANLFIEQYGQETEEDDDLGYYSDGQKRTLTDDEIAIFRHSETQALLRERRLARDASLDNARQSEPGQASATEMKHKKIATKTAGRPSPPNEIVESTQRKWEHFIDPSEENPELLTNRRRARELDAIRPDSVDLAYGEEGEPTPQRAFEVKAATTFQWPSLGYTSDAMQTT